MKTGGYRSVAGALSLLLLTACGVPPTPVPSGSVEASPATTAEASVVPSALPSSPESEEPSPTASDTSAVNDFRSITQICENWGRNPPDNAIRCARAIKAVLQSPGVQPGIERMDFRFTPPCDSAASCPPRSPDRGWVVTRSSGSFSLFAITIGSDGSPVADGPLPAQAPTRTPAFQPPHPARAPIEGDVPAEVSERSPLPLCGVEIAPVGGPYAVGVRRCFLDGVLSGQPVEFLTRDHGTEGEEVLTLYRFAGQGPIISYDRDGGRWTYSACGISPVTGQLVFQRDGLCDRRDLESGA